MLPSRKFEALKYFNLSGSFYHLVTFGVPLQPENVNNILLRHYVKIFFLYLKTV